MAESAASCSSISNSASASSSSRKVPNINRSERQRRQKQANRARHRLLSIRHDVDTFVRPIVTQLQQTLTNTTTTNNNNNNDSCAILIANERCGSWYAQSLLPAKESYSENNKPHRSCYFKSTDGHKHLFSLKRLNLNVVREVVVETAGACIILDASASKSLPDSFSRTIPIWAAVLNRIALLYRTDLGLDPPNNPELYRSLHVPTDIVHQQEYETMESLIHARVQELYKAKAIVDPTWLATVLDKPLRPFWVTPQHANDAAWPTPEQYSDAHVYPIVCVNCSEYHPGRIPLWKQEPAGAAQSFWYTPGAADDHESWARHLVPRLFWTHQETILEQPGPHDCQDDACALVDQRIDSILEQEQRENEAFESSSYSLNETQNLFDTIGETSLAIGSRRAARPPDCWQHFEAVLNVTDEEYPDTQESVVKGNIDGGDGDGDRLFYLQLPVKEGKRDRTELERWMAVGILFCLAHAQMNRRILIHCAQGKDRSVAIAMAVIVVLCDLTYPLRWNEDTLQKLVLEDFLSMESVVGAAGMDLRQHKDDEDGISYKSSGLTRSLVQGLLGREGRDRLLLWIQTRRNPPQRSPLATKESLRIVLHLIQQDREKAEPTRSTMQKLNRFFMSSGLEASNDASATTDMHSDNPL